MHLPSSPLLHRHTPVVQLSVRSALAATIAFWAALFFRSDYAIYALVAAVMVTNLSPLETRKLAVPRLGGTVVGAVVGALMTYVSHGGPLAMGAAILTAMLLTNVAKLQSAAKMAGYMAALVMFSHPGDPWTYAWLRGLETVLGIAAAVLVSYAPKLVRTEPVPPAGGG